MSNPEGKLTDKDEVSTTQLRIVYEQLVDLDRALTEKDRRIDTIKADIQENYVTLEDYDRVNDALIEVKENIRRKDAEIARMHEKKADYKDAVKEVKEFAKAALRRMEKYTDHFDYGERAQQINNCNTLSILLFKWLRYEHQAFENEEAALREKYGDPQ